MNDAGGVRRGQRVGDLDRVLQGLGERRALGTNGVVERAALDVLHGDEVDAGGAVDVVDRDNAGVVEGGGGLGFLDEAAFAIRVGHGFAAQ